MPMLSYLCIVSPSYVSACATTDGLCRASRTQMLYSRTVNDPDFTSTALSHLCMYVVRSGRVCRET
jgi:hypothetical protein